VQQSECDSLHEHVPGVVSSAAWSQVSVVAKTLSLPFGIGIGVSW
jgi:hypothetical protein